MKRRTMLAAVGTATAGLAGCLASGNGGGDDGNGNDGGNGAVDDGSTDRTDDGIPSIEDSQIETAGQSCRSSDGSGATAERGDGRVTVDGTIGANDPCHEADLRDVEIHNRQLVLSVDVQRTGDGMCQQCLGAIDYIATVSITNVGGLHGVTVEHGDGDEHAVNWDEPGEPTP